MVLVNQVRGYYYLSGVLMNQQKDPFCGKCKAFVNTTTTARENLAKFEREYASELQRLPVEFRRLLAEGKPRSQASRCTKVPWGRKKRETVNCRKGRVLSNRHSSFCKKHNT
jgi:hypothetical protein